MHGRKTRDIESGRGGGYQKLRTVKWPLAQTTNTPKALKSKNYQPEPDLTSPIMVIPAWFTVRLTHALAIYAGMRGLTAFTFKP